MTVSLAPADSETPESLPVYRRILLATDSSDYANCAAAQARMLAEISNGTVTASHVYAARMHDARFKQMEGGLPEQFREEKELERQRDVHDDLITRGLSIITDSYLDHTESLIGNAAIEFKRRSLEGKNYRALVEETNNGSYDLLAMGALGLGAVKNSRVGTVCSRTLRRADIDTLVIKDIHRDMTDGILMVAVDGSARSFGALATALSLARTWRLKVEVVSVFDPYYHYVAFHRIAGVLSEEAGKVFRFKDQEKLHEEIIDSGLAKIYQGHLDVAQSIASDYDMEIETTLLDGKPHDVLVKHIRERNPALLLLGKTGIHADPGLDIGGNAEHLLQDADCNLLFSQRIWRPRLDVLADVTTSWTVEAEQRMQKVPDFVRPMARMAILRFAQQRGHTVITAGIVDSAVAELAPSHAENAMQDIVDAHDAGEIGKQPKQESLDLPWSDEARSLLVSSIDDVSLRTNIEQRAIKKARVAHSTRVEAEHLRAFLDESYETPATSSRRSDTLHWRADALSRLMRAPEGFMRNMARQRIELYAKSTGIDEINLEVAEAGLADAREAMTQAQQKQPDSTTPVQKSPSRCPFTNGLAAANPETAPPPEWTSEAREVLDRVPEGSCREMTQKAVNTIAAGNDCTLIDVTFVNRVLEVFEQGAKQAEETLPWDEGARDAISAAPVMVRGMLKKEIELWVKHAGYKQVEVDSVNQVKQEWEERGLFHLDPEDKRGGN